MNKLIQLFIITLASFLLSAQEKMNENKSLTLNKIDKEIILDGVIDDIWNYVDSITNYFQLEPYFNQQTSVKTAAKILTTEGAIYLLSQKSG